jgi:hypothetical protein
MQARWWLPVWCLGVGIVIAGAQALGGDEGLAAITFALFVLTAAAFGIAERSETLRGLGGSEGDERFAGIERSAMAFAGRIMALAVIVGWVVELARGNDGIQYAWVLGAGTIAYLAAAVVLRRRR